MSHDPYCWQGTLPLLIPGCPGSASSVVTGEGLWLSVPLLVLGFECIPVCVWSLAANAVVLRHGAFETWLGHGECHGRLSLSEMGGAPVEWLL